MSKHTKGPWIAANSKNGKIFRKWAVYYRSSRNHEAKKICTLSPATNGDEEYANARLIAAAPDMLETLKMLVEVVVPNQDPVILFAAIEKARAIINKIEQGE